MSARERMDIISAYREVGTYRGAAADLRHHPQDREAGDRPARGRRRRAARGRRGGTTTTRWPRWSAERVREDAGPDHGEAAAAGGAGGGLCGVGAQLPPAGRGGEAAVAAGASPWPPAGGVVAGRASGDRLGQSRAGCRCSARCWPGRRWRFVRFAADERAETTLALLAECFEALGGVPGEGAGRPDGLPEGRRGRQRGRPDRRTMCGSRRTTGSGPTSARPHDPRVEGDRGEPGRLRQADLMVPQATVRRPGRRERRGRGVVRRGQRRGALARSARSRPSGWLSSGSCCAPLPSLRAEHRHGW